MRELVDVQPVEAKVGNLVYKPAIFGANAKILRDIEIGAPTINESAARLSVCPGDDELLRWIKNQSSTSAQDVRPHISYVDWNVRY